MAVYIDDQIAAVRRLHHHAFANQPSLLKIRDTLTIHADAIYQAHGGGDKAVAFHLGSWSPDFVGKPIGEIMSSRLSHKQVQTAIAREYGFADWAAVQELGAAAPDVDMESAIELVINGKLDQLEQKLELLPHLVHEQSRFGHGSTLLHYLGANGVESHRQISPLNASDVANCLIKAGADVHAKALMYGGSTTLALVATSAHPANAGVREALMDVLEGAGAT